MFDSVMSDCSILCYIVMYCIILYYVLFFCTVILYFIVFDLILSYCIVQYCCCIMAHFFDLFLSTIYSFYSFSSHLSTLFPFQSKFVFSTLLLFHLFLSIFVNLIKFILLFTDFDLKKLIFFFLLFSLFYFVDLIFFYFFLSFLLFIMFFFFFLGFFSR